MKDQVRATEKAMRSNKRAAADSSSDENSRANKTNKKRKKGKDNKSKSSRTTAHGTARYCAELCKRAGMPYGKYSSHSTSQCKDAAEMKAKLSGGYKDRAEANNSWKKEQKAMLKEVKVLKKQNKKQLMKIMAKSKSSKKERKILHKIVNRTKSISLDSSDSDSGSSGSSDDSDSD